MPLVFLAREAVLGRADGPELEAVPAEGKRRRAVPVLHVGLTRGLAWADDSPWLLQQRGGNLNYRSADL